MSTTRNIVDDLQGISGLDVHAGLYYTGGRESIYRPVLRKFIAFYGRGWPGLSQARSAAALQQLTHTLVGSAATIGATQVADQARALERACEAGAPLASLRPAVAKLSAELQRLTAELARRLH